MPASPLLNVAEAASVFCGGILSPNRLDHPEGLCLDPKDGALWCGGEGGQLYRIAPDGSSARRLGSSGGFALGLCMDRKRNLYMCDLHHACVVVFDDQGNEQTRLHGVDGDQQLTLPNHAVLSPDDRHLYVSNTCREGGPGIWRFDLHTGESRLWMSENCLSANGLALAPDASALYLVESHLPGISRIPILPDGRAGKKEVFLSLPDDEPDGLAFNGAGDLFISIYHPSRIYRYRFHSALLQTVIQDDSTDFLHHATNIAFRGDEELFSANLGAWHITRIDLQNLS